MREFYLQNEKNIRYNLQDVINTSHLEEPRGLGYDEGYEYEKQGTYYTVKSQEKKQDIIKGKLLFIDYKKYQDFINYIESSTSLKIIYKPIDIEYYRDVKFESIEKRDIEEAMLECDVVFSCLSLFYTDNQTFFNIEFIQGASNFPLEFPFIWSDFGGLSVEYNNTGHVEAEILAEINGYAENPRIEVIKNVEKKVVETSLVFKEQISGENINFLANNGYLELVGVQGITTQVQQKVGKNLCDLGEGYSRVFFGKSLDVNGNMIDDPKMGVVDYVYIGTAGIYTIKRIIGDVGTNRIVIYDGYLAISTIINDDVDVYTTETLNARSHIRFTCSGLGTGEYDNREFAKSIIQLEKSKVPTSHEDYIQYIPSMFKNIKSELNSSCENNNLMINIVGMETKQINIPLQAPLRSLFNGTISANTCDYIGIKDGLYGVYRNLEYLELDGVTTGKKASIFSNGGLGTKIFTVNVDVAASASGIYKDFCTHSYSLAAYSGIINEYFYVTNNIAYFIIPKYSNWSTIDDVNNFLSTEKPSLIYKKAFQTFEPFEDQSIFDEITFLGGYYEITSTSTIKPILTFNIKEYKKNEYYINEEKTIKEIVFNTTIQENQKLIYSSKDNENYIVIEEEDGTQTNAYNVLSLENDNFFKLPLGNCKIKTSANEGKIGNVLYRILTMYKGV